MKRLVSTLTAFTLLQIYTIVFAANIRSLTSGDWNQTSTWVGGVVPTATDNAIIESGHMVNLTTSRTITDVTINGTGNLRLNTDSRTLTVTGNFTMNGTSAINGNSTSRAVNITGTLSIPSTASATIQNIALSVTGTTTIDGTLTLNTGNSATKSFGNLTVNGTFTNTTNNVPITVSGNLLNNGTFSQGTGMVTLTGGNTTISGTAATTTFDGGITVNKTLSTNQVEILSVIALTPTSTATDLTLTQGIFKLSSASTITPFYQNNNTSPYDVATNATLWVNHSSAVLNSRVDVTPNSSWSVQGTLRVSSGTVNIGSDANDFLAPRLGSTIFIEGGNLNITGRLSQYSENFTYTQTGGTVTVGTAGTSTVTDRAPFHLNLSTQTFNMSGGTIIITSSGDANHGYYNKSTTGTGMTGGTIQIGSSATSAGSIIGIESTGRINNLVVKSANVTARFMNNNHIIKNNVTITDGILDQGTENRNITVGGNWTNNSSIADPYIEGTSTVTFNGTVAQSITNNGNANGTNFYNATINNTSATAPQITANSNVTVQNTLTMTQGKVNLNSHTLTLGTSATSEGTLSYASGWLYGGTFTRWMKTNSTPVSNMKGLFPMGASLDYRPVWVGYNPSLTSGGTISVTHNGVYPAGTTPVSYLDASWGNTVEAVTTSSWDISSGNGLTTSGSSDLAIRFGGTGLDGGVNGYVLSDLNASLASSTVGTFSAASNSTVPLEVGRTGLSLTDFNNRWYVGTRDVDQSPLPVVLVKFTAELKNKQTQIYWSTTSETNNNYYTVEKSKDGITFEVVEVIYVNGDSHELLNYNLTDKNPYAGISYYRLKQTDLNGDLYYSKLISINNLDLNIHIFPNPASNLVQISGINDNCTITLINSLGQEILINQSGQSSFDISSIQEGMYFLNISDGDISNQHKLIIKR